MTSPREIVFNLRVDPRRVLLLMAVVITLLVMASTVAVGALAYAALARLRGSASSAFSCSSSACTPGSLGFSAR